MAIRIKGEDVPSTINELSTLKHGTYHMADQVHLYEPQRSNNFEFIVPKSAIDTLYVADGTGTTYLKDYLNLASLSESLRFSVKSVKVPHFTQEKVTVRRGNSTLNFAGLPTFEEGQIVIYDFIGAATKEILAAWQYLSYNPVTEKVGLGGDYKKDCYLIEYTPDYQEVRTWKLHGCWIKGLSEQDYDTDSGDKRQITANIVYDRAEIDYTDKNLLS